MEIGMYLLVMMIVTEGSAQSGKQSRLQEAEGLEFIAPGWFGCNVKSVKTVKTMASCWEKRQVES